MIRLLVLGLLFATAIALHAQESVCDLFSRLDSADASQVVVSGDLVISKDIAVLGASDCDNQYISRSQIWATALSLRPSPSVTPQQLKQFQNAADEADRLRQAGKTVVASATFSGRLRVTAKGWIPVEFTFDSFENLKVAALPDASTLPVIPICDLFQNLPSWKGKRIAIRGEFVSTLTALSNAYVAGAPVSVGMTNRSDRVVGPARQVSEGAPAQRARDCSHAVLVTTPVARSPS